MKPHYPKLVGAAVFAAYFGNAALNPMRWHLIDGANLIFHEAGHTLFGLFPFWLEIAGGSILQVAIPLVLAVYFFVKFRRWECGLMMMWAGQSALNVSVYAGDAMRTELPLIADGLTHDWNHLLIHFGMLRHTDTVAAVIAGLGWAMFVLGLGVAIRHSFKPETKLDEGVEPT